jgi:hypothetical protein
VWIEAQEGNNILIPILYTQVVIYITYWSNIVLCTLAITECNSNDHLFQNNIGGGITFTSEQNKSITRNILCGVTAPPKLPHINHSEKIGSACGGQLISMNFPF